MKHACAPPSRAPRGFTLVELMLVVAIIGLLSSVALPSFMMMQARSRSAERPVVLAALGRAMADIVQGRQGIPPGGMLGDWNPAGTPGRNKRVMRWDVSGWNELPMIVQGGTYYSYSFDVQDATAGNPASAHAIGQGDLDGDSVVSTETVSYTIEGYALRQVDDVVVPNNPDVL